jgi:putative Ca2+/H+ antiporter (TMEM165/GDT1 family)
MDALLTSIATVALAEMGDKTQLLAIVLAARFKKPWPIIAGIFAATILNHALAAAAGFYLAQFFAGTWFRYAMGAAFIAVGLWTLIPDKEDEAGGKKSAGGVFMTTLVSFFLVEIGDKTQIATALLAARFHDIAIVATGTTLGMLVANGPAVFLGEAFTKFVPLKITRIVAAVLFVVIGAWIVWSVATGG